MNPLALYIHWPFCKAKCPYCDFNSHVREGVEHERWRAALLAELEYMVAQLAPNHQLTSIFFGGGTPSLMEAETVAALIERAKELLLPHPEFEVTLEANPTSVEAAKFEAFARAGVNRVSLGVQSLREEGVRFLGREHSVVEALDAVQLAADVFPRYSFDMIYALPNQTVAHWEEELREALPYMRGHASLYQLTIEPNTAFHHAYHVKKAFQIPQDDHAAELYEVTSRILREELGMHAYEVSNYAVAGQESRHNLTYWRGESYIGIGPGAHGRLDGGDEKRYATNTLKSPERWLSAVDKEGQGLEESIVLTQSERLEERLIMGLRLAEGVQMDSAFEGIIDMQKLIFLQEQEYVSMVEGRLCVTSKGRLVLNSLLGMLVE